MPAGTAQGIAIRKEYKGASACLVEIDCRPQTVNRKIRDARTGPRVTKVVFVVDVGLPINPLGIKAQIMGGAMDGIAQALSYSLHLKDGHFLEGSWDDAFYTRQWNTPPEVDVIVMPATTGKPGGVGEFGVGHDDGGGRLRVRQARPARCRRRSRSATTGRSASSRSRPFPRSRLRRPTASRART